RAIFGIYDFRDLRYICSTYMYFAGSLGLLVVLVCLLFQFNASPVPSRTPTFRPTPTLVPEITPPSGPDTACLQRRAARRALIAFTLGHQKVLQVGLMSADGSIVCGLTGDGYINPSWSPDGSQLVFVSRSGGLFIARRDGSALRQLLKQTSLTPGFFAPR